MNFAWNDHGTGKGLLAFNDSADSNYHKVISVVMNDTPGWTASAYTEVLGADNGDRNAGGTNNNANCGSITADTSNGNFVLWLRGVTSGSLDGSATAAVVTVADNGTITHNSGTSTVFTTMAGHAGLAADWNNKGRYTYSNSEGKPLSTTTSFGMHNENGGGIYDPDADCHVFMWMLYVPKMIGFGEFSQNALESGFIRAMSVITLAGSGDRTITVSNPDWYTPKFRGGWIPIAHNQAYGWAIAYDTTHDTTYYEENLGGKYLNHDTSVNLDFRLMWQGTTVANKYRKSNMENFIGFNTAAVDISSSTAATITVKGGLNENQSSLTKGQKYYIADGGKLRTSVPLHAYYLYKAGIATDTTKLLVQADYMDG